MKKFCILMLLSILPVFLFAAEDPWAFDKGQVFISLYAGFLQTRSDVSVDALYDLCFSSAISRNISLGFSYTQKQSQLQSEKKLVIPLDPGTPRDASDLNMLSNIYISSKTYTVEGEYHFVTWNLKRFDLSAGAGVGIELNKSNSIEFRYIPGTEPEGSRLEILSSEKSKYFPVAHFYASLRYYLARTLALAIRGGYQYSGISGYSGFLGLGITFRVH